METIYDLRADMETIRLIQEASLYKPGFGFVQDPALFGSAEWWAAVDSGSLPVFEACGTISLVYMGSMGDWPEFEATLDDGTVRSWTRQGDDEAYAVGRRVCVRMVKQQYKPNSHSVRTGEPCADVVLSISVDRVLA